MDLVNKIIMGALHNQEKINPLDYCYSALKVQISPVAENSIESDLIRSYIKLDQLQNTPFKSLEIFKIGDSKPMKYETEERIMVFHGTA